MTIKIHGPQRASGTVNISGAKNEANKLMIASLLTDEEVRLDHFPIIEEMDIVRELCEQIGSTVEIDQQQRRLKIRTPAITNTEVLHLSRKNRIAVLALAPLLHRAGRAILPAVAGDPIGPRPVNYHIEILRRMGASIEQTARGFEARVEGRLRGTRLELPYPSVGATETALFSGVLAEGRTTITNAAIEPEIVDLIQALQNMGAIIELGADRKIVIDGVERLSGLAHTVIPDRIEAASYAIMGIVTSGEVFCRGARQHDLITFLNTVRRLGADYRIEDDGIRFFRRHALRGIDVETDTHPGYMTDWQQPLVVLLTSTPGTSVVHETVYEDRFGYTESLRKMGADITIFAKCLGELPCRFRNQNVKHSAVIKGPTPLRAIEDITITDIRAGISHIIAALIANGTSTIQGIEHVMRGYEDLFGKLHGLGVEVKV